MKQTKHKQSWILGGWVLAASMVHGQGQTAPAPIDITKPGGQAPIPISISGFSGEVDSTLRFDLEIAGFRIVAGDQSQFRVSGANDANVQGQVQDRLNQAVLLAKSYTGGTPRQQTHAFADDVVLALTKQRGIAQTKIAFRTEQKGVSEICIADYDGHNAQVVTRDGSIVAAPAWVPGKRVLLYTSYRLGNPDIYSHDLRSGSRAVVARYSGLNTSAAASADGTRVAMILSKAGSPDVYVANLDGGDLKQVTKTREDESSPCWSPDGRTLCFVSRESGRAALYTVPAAGGTMKRLPTPGVFNATEPDWSPDGKTIVFTTQRGGAAFELCIVRADGGGATALGVSGEDPSWAPNSRTVIFTRRVGNGQRKLSLLDVPTKQIKDIAQVAGSSSQPSWAD
jgi:TolB protein